MDGDNAGNGNSISGYNEIIAQGAALPGGKSGFNLAKRMEVTILSLK